MLDQLDREYMPTHVGIIMDGNGRWAKKRMMPRNFGHKQGVETLKKITEECSNLGIKYLTVYAFSTENWKRSGLEISTFIYFIKAIKPGGHAFCKVVLG